MKRKTLLKRAPMFYECTKKDNDKSAQSDLGFVRIDVRHDRKYFISQTNFDMLMDSDEQFFVVQPLAYKMEYSISKETLEGTGGYVSADHCQAGSDKSTSIVLPVHANSVRKIMETMHPTQILRILAVAPVEEEKEKESEEEEERKVEKEEKFPEEEAESSTIAFTDSEAEEEEAAEEPIAVAEVGFSTPPRRTTRSSVAAPRVLSPPTPSSPARRLDFNESEEEEEKSGTEEDESDEEEEEVEELELDESQSWWEERMHERIDELTAESTYTGAGGQATAIVNEDLRRTKVILRHALSSGIFPEWIGRIDIREKQFSDLMTAQRTNITNEFTPESVTDVRPSNSNAGPYSAMRWYKDQLETRLWHINVVERQEAHKSNEWDAFEEEAAEIRKLISNLTDANTPPWARDPDEIYRQRLFDREREERTAAIRARHPAF